MRYYRERWKMWLRRNWWWLACAYGTFIVLGMWTLVAEAKPPDATAILLTSSLCAATLTCVMAKLQPPYGKQMTFRQARFNPGND